MPKNTGKNALFIVHGGPALDKNYLFDSMSALASDAELCFFDYPRGASFQSIVSYVVEQIEKRASEKYSVLAHSWGNPLFLAALPALQHKPEQAILVTPFPIKLEEARNYFSAIRGRIEKTTTSAEFARIDEIDKNPMPELDREYTRLIAPAYVHDRRHAPKVDFSSYQRAEASRIFGSMGNFDFSLGLSLLPKKTLLLLSESDFLAPSAAETFRRKASQTYEFKEAGHSPFAECPDQFLTQVRNFLRAP